MKGGVLWRLLLAAAVAWAALWLLGSLARSAREKPSRVEAFLARGARSIAMPRAARRRRNPVVPSPEVLAAARAHFADHCASCHGPDGSGDTTLGASMYPPAPDMRAAPTQRLGDAELFYVIENGVRFTGMPAFGTGKSDPAGEKQTWDLVTFIRHLPRLTPDELGYMQSLNPL